jgi:hypothetical protein
MVMRRFTPHEGKHDTACLNGTPVAPAPDAVAEFSLCLTEPSAWGGIVDVDIRDDAAEFPAYKDPTFVPVAIWSECKALRARGFRGAFRISILASSDQLQVRRRYAEDEEKSDSKTAGESRVRAPTELYMAVSLSSENACAALHRMLEALPVFDGTVSNDHLPAGCGIYFFYEDAGELRELCSHTPRALGIVRVGISSGTGTRISHHYHGVIPIEAITLDTLCPKDRSVMRKHIGRALLNRPGHPHGDYLELWNIDLTEPAERELVRSQRRIDVEKAVEHEVSEVLQRTFRFRYLVAPTSEIADQWETQCIGILASCPTCRRSSDWLGRHHPDPVISLGKLWNVRKVNESYRGPLPFDLTERLKIESSGSVPPRGVMKLVITCAGRKRRPPISLLHEGSRVEFVAQPELAPRNPVSCTSVQTILHLVEKQPGEPYWRNTINAEKRDATLGSVQTIRAPSALFGHLCET